MMVMIDILEGDYKLTPVPLENRYKTNIGKYVLALDDDS